MKEGDEMFKGDPFKGDGITFTFEGNYEVDALSVAKAIQSLVEISTISASHNYPDVEFRLSVKAIALGSLKFAFSAVAQAAQTLFTPESINYSKNLMESVKTAFEI